MPVHDGGDAFTLALAALDRLSPRPVDLIVVEDGPQESACRYPDSAQVLRLPARRGPAAARNQGAAAARGDVLFFVDADVALPPGAVATVQAAFADATTAAVIGSYDRHPPAPGFVSQFKNLAHRFVHQHARQDAGTFWGACGAMRRDVFARLGGFDEGYTEPSVEDIELGMRLHRAGGRIRLLKTLEVTHLKQWTWRSLLVTDITRRAVPWSRLLLAGGALPDDLNLAWRARVAAVLNGALASSLLLALLVPQALVLAALSAVSLVAIDWRLWMYFAAARGWWFALRAMPMQWLYYAYSATAFAWVWAQGDWRAARRAGTRLRCE